jgi:hypothetical protein
VIGLGSNNDVSIANETGEQVILTKKASGKAGERRLNRHNRMFQGMDESDAHLVQSGSGAAGVDISPAEPRRQALT